MQDEGWAVEQGEVDSTLSCQRWGATGAPSLGAGGQETPGGREVSEVLKEGTCVGWGVGQAWGELLTLVHFLEDSSGHAMRGAGGEQ